MPPCVLSSSNMLTLKQYISSILLLQSASDVLQINAEFCSAETVIFANHYLSAAISCSLPQKWHCIAY